MLNVDDPFGASLAANLPVGCERIRTTVRGARGAELSARLKRADLDGLDLEISGRFGDARLVSKLIGDFNAENLLGALGRAARRRHAAPGGLRRARERPGGARPHGSARRLAAQRPWVVIDYAHTPDALQRALKTLDGPRAARDHLRVRLRRRPRPRQAAAHGRRGGGSADRIVLTDDNPRNEDPAEIVRDIRVGLGDHPTSS